MDNEKSEIENSEEESEEENEECEICKETTSNLRDGFLQLKEWLFVDSKCTKCGRNGCDSCILVCFSCGCEGEEITSICKFCNEETKELMDVSCTYHCWYICNKHLDSHGDNCCECGSNKNYIRYGF